MKTCLVCFLTFCLAIFSANAQTMQEAEKYYNDFFAAASHAAQRPDYTDHYEILHKSYECYSHIVKSQLPSSPDYKKCKERLVEIFPVFIDAAYKFAEKEDEAQAIRFAQASVDLSLMYVVSDQNLTSSPDYPDIAYFAAYFACEAGNYKDAIPYFRAYLSTTDTENREYAFQNLVFSLMQEKLYDEASYAASLATDKYPTNWSIVKAGIEAADKTLNDEYMQKFLTLGLKLNPSDIGLVVRRAKLAERQENYEDALTYYKRLDVTNPNNMEICCHLALDSYNKGVQMTETANLMPNEGDAKPYKDKAAEAFNYAIPLLEDVVGTYPYATNFAKALALSCSMVNDATKMKLANDQIVKNKGKAIKSGTAPYLIKDYNLMPDQAPVINQDDFVSDVDEDIPSGGKKNPSTYAIIIGNEKYSDHSTVSWANNDANSFEEYCKKVLGIPQSNIRKRLNATMGQMGELMNFIKEKASMNPGKLNFLVYYAGHGLPDVSNGHAYLLPCDASGTDFRYCYSLDKMYEELDAMDAKGVTVFLDACFSGATRDGGMISNERMVVYEPEDAEVNGKTVVFSATQEKQTALPYDEQHHGIFTYYLLKNLKEEKGMIKLGELAERLCEQVDNTAFDTKNKHQVPRVQASDAMGDDWKELMLLN